MCDFGQSGHFPAQCWCLSSSKSLSPNRRSGAIRCWVLGVLGLGEEHLSIGLLDTDTLVVLVIRVLFDLTKYLLPCSTWTYFWKPTLFSLDVDDFNDLSLSAAVRLSPRAKRSLGRLCARWADGDPTGAATRPAARARVLQSAWRPAEGVFCEVVFRKRVEESTSRLMPILSTSWNSTLPAGT